MPAVHPRRRIARTCVGLALTGATLLATGAPTSAVASFAAPAPLEAAVTPSGLTWAPPTGYQDFVPMRVPAAGGTLRLDDRTDYLLDAPTTITGPVEIRGGRNVVWIGGHIDLDACCSGSATDRRAVMVTDGSSPVPGRVVHLEGLRIEGDALAEGIDTNADVATIQIQNVRVDNLRLAAGGHPDVIQAWGSYGELRVDRLTGRTDYQGLFLRVDLANHPRAGDIYLRRVDLEAFATAESVGHTLYSIWNDSTGRVRTDQVYSQAHASGHYGSGADRATILVEDDLRVYPQVTGDVMTWPAHPAKVRNWDDSGPGSVRVGTPTEGDFVPASAVGLGYVSPGYGPLAPVPEEPGPVPDDDTEQPRRWARAIRPARAVRSGPRATTRTVRPVLSARERVVARRVNDSRAARGRHRLVLDERLMRKAQQWADHLARADRVGHSRLRAGAPRAWRILGENVGVGSSGVAVHDAFEARAGTRRTLLGRWSHFGVGYAADDERVYVVQVFMRT